MLSSLDVAMSMEATHTILGGAHAFTCDIRIIT